MRGVPFGVAVVAAGLYLLRLGQAPFLDPPEGFHAEVAQSILVLGDWMRLQIDGIPYFDKPPLLYWLMALSFSVAGPSEVAARVWPALAAVGIAAVTARLGVVLGGARLGMLAGLMVVANLGMYLYGRLVKPDVPFILCLVLAYAGFAVAYRGGGRRALALFYVSLGLATLTKDILGAVGPLVIVGLFFLLTRERPMAPWVPWWGILLAIAIAGPWYAAVEWHHRGFLWYTIVDNHVLNVARQRVFPDEDVPLGSLPFLGVTFLAFLPWTLAAPAAIARALRRPWEDATARLWVLIALWPLVVIGFFTLSPFKLPHYALPAFPALALLVARVWDESIEAAPGSPRPRALIMPVLIVFALAALAMALAALDRLPLPAGAMNNVDLATRNLAARGQAIGGAPPAAYLPVLRSSAIVFGATAVVLAWAAWTRRPGLAVWTALAGTLAFLPLAGDGMAQFAQSRSTRPIAEALAIRLRPADDVIHEGPLENSGSVLLLVDRPVRIVNGLRSNLAFGATFPEARDRFWSAARLQEEWTKPGRRFLITGLDPAHSVVRTLPPASVHAIAHAGGRWLYANVAVDAGPEDHGHVNAVPRYTLKADPFSSHSVILDWLAEGHGRRLLDVGAADGLLSRHLTERGWKVTGIEADPAMAAAGAAHCERMLAADLNRGVPALDGLFDTIVCGDVLEHLADPAGVLRDLVEALAPGGDVVVSVPNVAHLWVRLSLLVGRFEYADRGILDRTHLRFFTRRTLDELVTAAGLEPVQRATTPVPLYQAVAARWHGPALAAVHAASAAVSRALPRMLGYQFVVRARRRS